MSEEERSSAEERGAAPLRITRRAGDVVLEASLVAPLGSGHCSTVWRAKEKDGSPVAVKLFEAPKGDWVGAHTAFLRGVSAMERLSEPSAEAPATIVRVRRSSGPGFVMTLAEQGNIVDLPALQWPPRRVASFFGTLCEAIAFAHDKGVFHRCLKPSNILLADGFEPLVVDFDMVDHPLSSPGKGGYAPYLAPEALRGERTDSPAADIYSLGRILYFLLLGEDPDEPVQLLPDLLPLSEQPLGLVRIIRKCTCREPAMRYRNVSELLADLARYDDEQEVGLAPDPATSERMSSPGSQRGDLSPYSRRRLPSGSWGEDDAPPLSTRSPGPSSVRGGEVAPASRRSRPTPEAAPEAAPEAERGFSAGARRSLALLGGVAFPVSVALLLGTALPGDRLILGAHIGAAASAALLTLVLPIRFRFPRAGRVALALAVGFGLYLIEPSWLVKLRLRATLSTGSAQARAAAVKALAREGRRTFDKANLSSLDLQGADLVQATFRGADLSDANLCNAAMIEAVLDGADLGFALLLGTDFREASLDQVVGLESAQCDAFTRFPPGWSCTDGHPARTAAEGPSPEPPGSPSAAPPATTAEPAATTAEPAAPAAPSSGQPER